MVCLSLCPPTPKSFFISPRTYPLRTQTQSPVLPSSTIYTTKLGENLFNNRNGEKYITTSKRLSPIVCAAGGEDIPQVAKQQQIISSVLWTRIRKALDVAPGSPAGMVVVALMHLLCVFAPFCFSWGAVGLMLGLYVITGMGITISYHRNLCHRSFKLPKWLEYTFAYCGVHALQGDPIVWVSDHRYHHQYVDSKNDPHSPIEGFWYSHVGWLYDFKSANERSGRPTNVGDLESQLFYKFIHNTYIFHPIILAALLYAIGGFPYIVWGMGVRIVWVYHITLSVNSACHLWGNQAWNTGDLSRNNWIVALLSFGEGWHNNHHAFEFSARHGLEWWQFDSAWCIVWALQTLGLATDVKVPTDAHKRKMTFNSNSVAHSL